MHLDSVFKSYDIRGRVPQEVTTELAYGVGQALAQILTDKGPVAVGRDMRPDSQALANSLTQGLAKKGRQVWDIGLVTTDMLLFTVGKFKLAGGAMITASHNPKGYNGIKLCGAEATPIGAESGLNKIKNLVAKSHKQNLKRVDGFPASSFQPPASKVIQKDVTADWINHLLKFINVGRWPAYKVAVDAGNGMVGAIWPQLQLKLPLKVTPLYFKLDGSFPNRPSDPSQPQNLTALVDVVKVRKLDLGLAFDGDGDRVVFVDDKAKVVPSSQTIALVASELLKHHPGSNVVKDIRSSKLIDTIVVRHGGKIVRSRVGGPHIAKAMQQSRAIFGGEAAGHYYFTDNWCASSGMMAALTVIDIMASSGKSLSQLLESYPKYFQSGELNFAIADKEAVLAKLAKQFPGGEQDWLDGLTVNYQDWWFNARPGNTESLLRFNVEAASKQLLKDKTKQLRALINA